jgi:hypothetical protein
VSYLADFTIKVFPDVEHTTTLYLALQQAEQKQTQKKKLCKHVAANRRTCTLAFLALV